VGKSIEEVAKLLAEAELFETLDSSVRAACAAKFRQIQVAKGDMMFARGDPGTHMYLVAGGLIRLAIATDEGRELSFQIVGRGDLFGEIAVLDRGPRSAEAIALSRAVVWSLEAGEFHRLRADHPAISDAAIALLCLRLRTVSDKLETIALHSLEVRLARFILTALRGQPDIPGRRLPLGFDYSQSELAQLLGASRPKVNVALGALEQAGAIGRTADRLFCDRAKLAVIANIE